MYVFYLICLIQYIIAKCFFFKLTLFSSIKQLLIIHINLAKIIKPVPYFVKPKPKIFNVFKPTKVKIFYTCAKNLKYCANKQIN